MPAEVYWEAFGGLLEVVLKPLGASWRPLRDLVRPVLGLLLVRGGAANAHALSMSSECACFEFEAN